MTQRADHGYAATDGCFEVDFATRAAREREQRVPRMRQERLVRGDEALSTRECGVCYVERGCEPADRLDDHIRITGEEAGDVVGEEGVRQRHRARLVDVADEHGFDAQRQI